MKTRLHTRDRREDRSEREEKLGQAMETLPGKTLRDRLSPPERKLQPAPGPSPGIRAEVGEPVGHRTKPREVLKSARFQLEAAQAEQVYLAGTFNHWEPRAVPLTKGVDGSWNIELQLTPGDYEYQFVVDGVWQEDPLACRFAQNPFGGRNSIIQIT